MIFFLLVALLAAVEDTAGLKASVLSKASLGNAQKMMADSKYEFKDDSDGGECGCHEVCTPPWVSVGRSCLLADLSAAVSMSRARHFCKEMNAAADLVVFKDANEFAEVLRYVMKINYPKKNLSFWIGAVDESNNDSWFWITGEPMPLGAPFWGAMYEGDDTPWRQANEPCALLYYRNRYYIHDAPCNFGETAPLCQYIPA